MSTANASSPASSNPKRRRYKAGEFEPHLDRRPGTLRRLQILQVCSEPGDSFSASEIARFCKVSKQAIVDIENRAILKLGKMLLKRHPELFSEIKPV